MMHSAPPPAPMTPENQTSVTRDHEVLAIFAAAGLPLSSVLVEMLNEHFSHRSERRGCGFTQATRHLAEFVNSPRQPLEFDEVRLFDGRDTTRVRSLLDACAAAGVPFGWRNLDRRDPPDCIQANLELRSLYTAEVQRQRTLRALPSLAEKEESRLLMNLIIDLILPNEADDGSPLVPAWPERLPIGTCPLAEKYFLEIADSFVRRKGRMNVVVDRAGKPVLIEKLHLGDDHSCMTLEPLRLNGVCLPPGSLLGVTYQGDVGLRPNKVMPGVVIPLDRCLGFRFLRLTTLSVSPVNRARAFSSHFEAQVAGGLFSPGDVTMDQIRRAAQRQV